MAKKMFLDIQMFGDESSDDSLYIDDSLWNSSVQKLDNDIVGIDDCYIKNKGTFERLKAVAGSPVLNSALKQKIDTLTNVISESAAFFDSVGGWTTGVKNFAAGKIGVGVDEVTERVCSTCIDNPGESFEGDAKKGIKSVGDVEAFSSEVISFMSELESAWQSIPKDAGEARDSLPDNVINSLKSTFTNSSTNAIESYNNTLKFVKDELNNYKDELLAGFNALADGAAGRNGN